MDGYRHNSAVSELRKERWLWKFCLKEFTFIAFLYLPIRAVDCPQQIHGEVTL